MNDLRERLRHVERVTPPDLWSQIVEREPAPTKEPGRRSRLLVAVALAAVIAAVGAGVLVPLSLLRHSSEGTADSGRRIMTLTYPSESMEPTIHVGRVLVVDLDAYRSAAPQRGDIVAFRTDGQLSVKRVIGLAGDVVEERRGKVLVNGEPLDEPYVRPDDASVSLGPWTMPAGYVFVMGDNRPNSNDSRYGMGPIPLRALVGMVLLNVYPTSAPPAPTAPASGIYTDSEEGWTITYPASLQLRPFEEQGRVSSRGIAISNFGAHGSGSNQGLQFLRSFPPKGVSFQLWRSSGGPFFVPTEPDSHFPLSLGDFELTEPYVGGSEPRPRFLGFIANGQPYTAAVWIGPAASSADRDAMAGVVASIRFLPLKEGTAADRFFVLGRPSTYPVGSVTRFDAGDLPASEQASRLPFYLIHVDQGFYALAWPNGLVGGYRDCDVRFDPNSRQFSCSQSGARWDIRGKVLTNPNPSGPDDPLAALLVRISLDGHVLVSTNVFIDIRTDLDVT
jgi:signal peptidase I